MNDSFTPDFPGDASARHKSRTTPMPTRNALLSKNSFPGPDDNRFIDAFMKQQREITQH